MIQKRIVGRMTQDEHTDQVILKMIDSQIEIALHRKEILEKQIKEIDMEIEQFNWQRRKLINEGWKEAIDTSRRGKA